ncbi:iron chelate uptake ABC transporter family permease subunit [soil metagenome]
MGILGDLFTDYTLRTVALGSATLGAVSGVLGSFAVLRKQSLVGDAISHAALPGIAIAFLVTRSKAPLVLVVGAAVAGWLATLFVMTVVRAGRVKYDSALGLALSMFFGFGLVLLTFIQRLPDANQAGLDKFLFGQAAALVADDVEIMAALGALAVATTAIFWKEFKLLSFDPGFGASVGFPMRGLDVLLTSLLVIAIVIGLQTVGVVLMSAMIVAPAAAARQWTDRLAIMVVLAALFGALAGVIGAAISGTTAQVPTGPTIVLVASVIVGFSLLFATNRGLAFRWMRERRSSRLLRTQAVLADLYTLSLQHRDPDHAHPSDVLEAMSSRGVEASLDALHDRGLARRMNGGWALTAQGRAEAERMDAADREPT